MSTAQLQLNITYSPEVDRLLLRAHAGNAGEFRVWLTRRFSGLLANVLVDLMDKEGGMLEIASNRDTISQLKNGAFTQEYASPQDAADSKAGGTALPLGTEGILGYRINANRRTDGLLNLQLLPEQGPGLNMDLNRTLVFMLYNLLEQGLARADWNLPLPQTHKDPVH